MSCCNNSHILIGPSGRFLRAVVCRFAAQLGDVTILYCNPTRLQSMEINRTDLSLVSDPQP